MFSNSVDMLIKKYIKKKGRKKEPIFRMNNCSWRSALKAFHLARERLNGTSGQNLPAIQRAVVYNKVTFHNFWH